MGLTTSDETANKSSEEKVFETARTEADYRYAHALYNMAERIRDRHPHTAVHLEKAADLVLQTIDPTEEGSTLDDADWKTLGEPNSGPRPSATNHWPARAPSLSLPHP